MIDYNIRIIEKQRLEAMQVKAEPLIIVVAVCLIAIGAESLMDIYAAKKYASEIKNSESFVACLNKNPVQIGDEWAHCRVEKLSLVAGIRQ